MLVASLAGGVPAGAAGALKGVDVSSYQHPNGARIDWRAVARAGARFAFIKATEGAGYVNPYFATDWAGARAAGLVRGAYAFARPAEPLSTAADQARRFVAVVGTTRELGDLPPVLDLEESGGLPPAALVAWTADWLATARSLTGRVPILYTGIWFWSSAMGGNGSFGAYPLWEPDYSSQPPGPLPGWSQWTFWQHTDAARYPGIAGPVDESYLCCGAGTLAGLADGRTGAIVRLWLRLGGASGVLGLPAGPERAVPGGWAQSYQHGLIVWTHRYGVHAVIGAIAARLATDGGPAGPLGVPVDDQHGTARHAVVQHFAGGAITSSAAAGTHAVWGAIYSRWSREGGPLSRAGLPTGEPARVPGGRSQQFQGAGMYRGGSGPVFEVPGAIRDRYEQMGGPSSPLGLPTSNAYHVLTGLQVRFHVGSLTEIVVAGQPVVV